MNAIKNAVPPHVATFQALKWPVTMATILDRADMEDFHQRPTKPYSPTTCYMTCPSTLFQHTLGGFC